ncbi:class I SAM-dependent methyltransferase [Blastococcus saxobsidens]|uniref:Ubiquinone/menaquinone biosynthesis C-methylase UbiE n=1 Tax=Blastococcus saxobsidens TaxID=138336 RepID=A0A4Q7Y972_9ACTN|nr:class I SAM-dependent methyltransferase [Blastococcus saxobsidens]RZU32691.1 ubiquinone/menaquinone biosynthesis C-methylase UbiE [Blastococcus saxobsidens]
MAIDFHAEANRRTYAGRQADGSWRDAVRRLVEPRNAVVVDVGCGGGSYTRAWHELGAAMVLGVDSSAQMLDAAREANDGLPGLDFRLGDATATALADGCADVVFARALVHHTPDLAAVVAEAFRLLHAGGTYLVQDRTADDVAQAGSPTHPRGWMFEVHPRLLEVESRRRPDPAALESELTAAGFDGVAAASLWEVRRRYEDREDYLAEIGARTGRSILHELDDAELATLVHELRDRLPEGPLTETDRWTIWRATRPA